MKGTGLLASLAVVAALGCGGGGGDSMTGPTPAANAVTVGNNFFSPATTSVPAGTTVTWTWANGAVEHNVTFDDGGPNSSTQSSGSFARTFATPGTYAYHCTIHGAAVMHGTVTVGASSGTGGSSGGNPPPGGGMGGGY